MSTIYGTFVDTVSRKRARVVLLCSFIILCLYVLTNPQNHSEAEDAFDYAAIVEDNTIQKLFHPHHLLYVPLMRMFYFLGIWERSFPMMLVLNKIFGVITIGAFVILLKNRFRMPPQAALIGGLLLSVSYGFWRYSYEAEVYILGCLTSVLLCLIILNQSLNYRLVIVGGLVGAAALMAHIVNVTLVCVAIPVYFLLQKKFRQLSLYMLTVSCITIAVYYMTYRLDAMVTPSEGFLWYVRGGIKDARSVSLMNIPKGLVGFGQSVVSGNFMFSLQKFNALMSSVFPERMLAEEAFMGKQAGSLLRFSSVLTCISVVVATLFVAVASIKERHPINAIRKGKELLAAAVWLVAYAAFILWFEPGNPEMWIIGLIPFWIFITCYILNPLLKRRPGVVFALVGTLLAHNYIGGMLLIKDEKTDYNYQKAAWLLANTSQQDTIVTLDNQVFSRYLRYHGEANVVNIFRLNETEINRTYEQLGATGGKVFATGDVLNLPAFYAHSKYKQYHTAAKGFAARTSQDFQKAVDNEFGGIFVRVR